MIVSKPRTYTNAQYHADRKNVTVTIDGKTVTVPCCESNPHWREMLFKKIFIGEPG